MTHEDAKELLLDRIVGLQGVKATQLVADPQLIDVVTSDIDIGKLCDELVAEGKIIEIEYVLADMNWRTKSFFLPAGSEVRVIDIHS